MDREQTLVFGEQRHAASLASDVGPVKRRTNPSRASVVGRIERALVLVSGLSACSVGLMVAEAP